MTINEAYERYKHLPWEAVEKCMEHPVVICELWKAVVDNKNTAEEFTRLRSMCGELKEALDYILSTHESGEFNIQTDAYLHVKFDSVGKAKSALTRYKESK